MEFIQEIESQEGMSPGVKAKKCKEWLDEHQGREDPMIVLVVKKIMKAEEARIRAEAAREKRIAAEASAEDERMKRIAAEAVMDERSLKRIRDGDFPALTDATSSTPYFPINHTRATMKKAQHERFPIEEVFPDFWRAPFVRESKICDSEITAEHAVVELLQAVLKGMKIEDRVDIVEMRNLAGTECDVLLVYKENRLPFAVIEVKKPGKSKEDRNIIWEGIAEKGGNRVAGEIFDEMKAVQLFGFSSVTGMITTFNQSKVVGLINDAIMEQKNGVYAFSNSSIREKFEGFAHRLPSMDKSRSHSHSPNEKTFKGSRSKTRIERQMWACDVVPVLDQDLDEIQRKHAIKKYGEDIANEFAFFVVHAISNLQDYLLQKHSTSSVDIRLNERIPCRNLKKGEKVFSFGTMKLTKVNLDAFCKADNLHVIHHLGIGGSGNVCLAVSDKGESACAVKFYHETFRQKELAQEELENWRHVYGNDNDIGNPYIIHTANGECLVMPYLHPIPPESRAKMLNGTIQEVLRLFAKSGFFHRDIKWRHFRIKIMEKGKRDPPLLFCGKPGDKLSGKVYLVDLGEGSLVKSKKSTEEWINECIETLKGCLLTEPAVDFSM